jgi:hypothetical protein
LSPRFEEFDADQATPRRVLSLPLGNLVVSQRQTPYYPEVKTFPSPVRLGSKPGASTHPDGRERRERNASMPEKP